VTLVSPPDADNRGVLWMVRIRVGTDCFVEAERRARCVRPVRRRHPAVVSVDDGAVRTVIRGELEHRALRKAAREFENVADSSSAKAIKALVLISDDAKVSASLRQLQQELFLNIIRVLVLIDK